MFREFFMEDWLETHRLKCHFNLGESGHRPLKVSEFLSLIDMGVEPAMQDFLALDLCDSPNWGRSDLRWAIAHLHKGASQQNVLVTTGTSEALFLLFNVLRPKKLGLILPGFQLLYEIPQTLGTNIVPLLVEFDHNAVPYANWEKWFKILQKQQPDMLLINHPHNPTGLVFSEDELRRLAAFCEKQNIFLVADEHYRFLGSVDNDLGPTLWNLAPQLQSNRLAITGSFIKCVGAPGLRIGWCVSNENTLKKMQSMKNYTTHTVNPISEWLSSLALKNIDSRLFSDARKIWLSNRKILQTFLQSNTSWLGIPPSGGLVCCLSPSAVISRDEFEKLARTLLNMGVFFLPLTSMEFEGFLADNALETHPNLAKGFGFRVGLGCCTEKFAEAMEILHEIKPN